MSDKQQVSSAQKLIPVAAPAAGAVLMVVFVVVAFTSGGFDKTAAAITSKSGQVATTLEGTQATDGIVEPGSQSLGRTPAAYEPGKLQWPPVIKGQEQLLQFPLRFRVLLEDPPGVEASLFEKLDTNKDGRLTRAEFMAKPGATDEEFNQRDTEPKDGFLSPAEFTKTLSGPPPDPTEFDLAPPSGVKAVLDYANPSARLSWTAPSLSPAPSDVGYLVFRASPKYLQKRQQLYRERDLRRFQAEQDEFDRDYREWLKTNPGKSRSEYETASNKKAPVRPPIPAEWELLTTMPISDTTYTDTAIELDCAFIYAVRTVTAKKLKPGVKSDATILEGYRASDLVVQDNRPVYFQNDANISFEAFSGESLVARVSRWHYVSGQWRRVEAQFTMAPGEWIGMKLKGSDLRSDAGAAKYKARVIGENGAPDEAMIHTLEMTDEIDFNSGWRYDERNAPSDPKISNRAGLQFVLPRGTRDQAPPPVALGEMLNPIELRVIAASPQTVRFELSRWHKSGASWYRVVYYLDARVGSTVGFKGKLADITRDAKIGAVYDLGGSPARNVSSIQPQDIALETGAKFERLAGRTLQMGEGRMMDLHAVQLVE